MDKDKCPKIASDFIHTDIHTPSSYLTGYKSELELYKMKINHIQQSAKMSATIFIQD